MGEASVGNAGRGGELTPFIVDAQARADVVRELARVFAAEYVFPPVGARVEAELLERLARGDYERAVSADQLASQLGRDLLDVARDKHVGVSFRARADEAPLPSLASPLSGLRQLKILDGNIGYVEIDGFPMFERAHAAVAGIFAIVQQTRALILDVRSGHGGDPRTVSLYASYLTRGPSLVLNEIYSRDGLRIQESRTADFGERGYGTSRPVIVLTSSKTFSADEALAYHLQALKRATIIGETTAGGAHVVKEVPLGHRFIAQLPYARGVSPITGGNWEGVGVKPDRAVSSARALPEALVMIQAELEQSKEGAAEQGEPPVLPGVIIARRQTSGPSAAPNLVYNGDFSFGIEPWGVSTQGAQGMGRRAYRVEDGRLCVDIEPRGSALIGWPPEESSHAIRLDREAPYQLSFKASASGALRIKVEAVVAHRLPPYTPIVSADVPVDARVEPFSFNFVPEESDDQVGLAFRIWAVGDVGQSTMCIDDVSVTRSSVG